MTTAAGPLVLPPLADYQWSLDDLVLGRRTIYNVSTFTVGGADLTDQDAPYPGADGNRFGVDTRSGRTITIAANTNAWTEADGLAAGDALEAAWDREDVRGVPGAQSVLRWRRGAYVRRAYGRTVDCLPDHSMDWTGNIPYTLSFRTSEPNFYDDVEQREVVPIVPEETGGFVAPLIGGTLTMTGEGVGELGFSVGGSRPTWMSAVIYGPIANPSITFAGQWSVTLDMTIGRDDYVLIDPTPWGRDVRRSDGANAAGAMTADSRVLSAMKLRPGHHAAILRGIDPTGTATAVIYWRNCHAAH
jgi:hypothetical protein